MTHIGNVVKVPLVVLKSHNFLKIKFSEIPKNLGHF